MDAKDLEAMAKKMGTDALTQGTGGIVDGLKKQAASMAGGYVQNMEKKAGEKGLGGIAGNLVDMVEGKLGMDLDGDGDTGGRPSIKR